MMRRRTDVRLLPVAGACLCASVLAACGSGNAEATWELAPGQQLTESSTTFVALVTRTGCNGGVTGDVEEPEISYDDSEIVVTFTVTPGPPDSATCPSNKAVPYEVELDEAIDGRSLVDGR